MLPMSLGIVYLSQSYFESPGTAMKSTFTGMVLSLCLAIGSQVCTAQIKQVTPPDQLVTFGDATVVRYRVGTTLTAARGPVKNVFAMMAVPLECPEQEVLIVDEDISTAVDSVEYRMLGEGVKQMLITIPYLAAGEEAHALVTFEVRTRTILPPEEKIIESLVIPKKVDRDQKRYLGRSDYIQSSDSKIRRTLKEILFPEETAAAETGVKPQDETQDESAEEEAASSPELRARAPHPKLSGLLTARQGEAESKATDSPTSLLTQPPAVTPPTNVEGSKETPPTNVEGSEKSSPQSPAPSPQPLTDWHKVEKLYDYVISTVKYLEGEDQSALETLQKKQGDCHDISALFVALCRAAKIPARMVWVHEHQYAEFALADAVGNLHWFPCESAGIRAFGEMPTPRVIMQKGDNFRIPERPRERFRYASEFLTADPIPGSGRPKQKFIREAL